MKIITSIICPALALFAFACFALSPKAQGQLTPPLAACYPNCTTAEGGLRSSLLLSALIPLYYRLA
jgi:hypothetical protein